MIVAVVVLALALAGVVGVASFFAYRIVGNNGDAIIMIRKLEEELMARTLEWERATFERDQLRDAFHVERQRLSKLEKIIDDLTNETTADLSPDDVAARVERLRARWQGSAVPTSSNGGSLPPRQDGAVSSPASADPAGPATVLK